MKKVKDFIKEHKWTIIGGTVGGALCGLGCYAGYSYCFRHELVLDDGIAKNVIVDAIKRYTYYTKVYGRAMEPDNGYKPTELGQLGKDMIKGGVPADKVFTHFIAIGSPDKK